ncbi:MAG: hypothetical protein ACE5F1_05640, partial [Planctomycetota bacterium]
HHLLNALRYHPNSPEILSRLLGATKTDPDARTLWGHRTIAALCDRNGRRPIDKTLARLLPEDDPFLVELAVARARAAGELARFVQQLPSTGRAARGNLVLARWAEGLAWELVRASPALLARYWQEAGSGMDRFSSSCGFVIRSLEKHMQQALNGQDPATAVRIASCLLGLATQAGFRDLKGPPALDMSRAGHEARRVWDLARERIREKTEDPFSVEELEQMSRGDRDVFTELHSSVDDPARALSPKKRYLVETVCGHQTLLGVARTVELHHRRLVSWYGEDPFENEQGLVRVYPEASDLEVLGTPHWWAAGFQSGDTTTVKFQCSNIESLGHTLTHELTHRFDGALFRSLPAWLLEGRAVWTEAAYSRTTDRSFVKLHVDPGNILTAWNKGYTREDKLAELIDGTIEEYRDNYPAGNTLFVFLSYWDGLTDPKKTGKTLGRPRYASRLEGFMKSYHKAAGDPLGHFIKHFCDGQDGRPESFRGFTEDFATFVHGFDSYAPAEWTSRYAKGVPALPSMFGGYVYDGPTWTWARERAEPWFGQDHARAAGDLLMERNAVEAAVAAYLWSLEVDEWSPQRAERLAELLERSNRADQAWAVRAENARRDPSRATPGKAPFLASLPRLRKFLSRLRAAAASYRTKGQALAAAVLEADRELLAAGLGLPSGPSAPLSFDEKKLALHPLEEPARFAGSYGWVEDELTGYETYRVEDLWYEGPNRDLHIGRSRPREGTGSIDRRARLNQIFVRTREWLPPGKHVLEARVSLTTSYAKGAIVLGHTRRDRNLRLEFVAGDYLYAVGINEEANEIRSVRLNLRPMWIRDSHLPGNAPGESIEFKTPAKSFEVECLIDGPELLVRIDGRFAMAYHTADGLAIQGHVGFAMHRGAVRIQEPTLRRLDRGTILGAARARSGGLHFGTGNIGEPRRIENRRLFNLPRTEHGSLVLWIPKNEDGALVCEQALEGVVVLARNSRAGDLPQSKVLVLPRTLDTKLRRDLEAKVARTAPGMFSVFTHDLDGPLEDHARMVFVDPLGVVRAFRKFTASGNIRRWTSFGHWLRVYRGTCQRR